MYKKCNLCDKYKEIYEVMYICICSECHSLMMQAFNESKKIEEDNNINNNVENII